MKDEWIYHTFSCAITSSQISFRYHSNTNAVIPDFISVAVYYFATIIKVSFSSNCIEKELDFKRSVTMEPSASMQPHSGSKPITIQVTNPLVL